MKIQYFGHSCFLLESLAGTRIVTDPFDGIGFPLPRVESNIVTISHGHFDHCNAGGVAGDPVILSKPGAFNAHGVSIEAHACYHDEENGARRGKNLIFKFVLDGLTVSHLGDLGERVNSKILQILQGTDVLLIPVGGNYTIDAAIAKEYVDRLTPQVVIPMHYKTAGLTVDVAPVKNFTELFSSEENIEILHCESEIALSKANLEEGGRKLIVMERRKA